MIWMNRDDQSFNFEIGISDLSDVGSFRLKDFEYERPQQQQHQPRFNEEAFI